MSLRRTVRVHLAALLGMCLALTLSLAAAGGTTRSTNPSQCLDCPYRDPAWSPSGRAIVFVADTASSGTHLELRVITPQGDAIRTLRPKDDRNVADPTWSPHGDRIAFGIGHLTAIGSDGTHERRLGGGCCPAWGPGGHKLAYSDSPEAQSQIYLANADGRRSIVAAAPRGGYSYWGPTWSPGGARLAFFADIAPDQSLSPAPFLAAIDKLGGRAQQLARGAFANPTWSPDGAKIAADGIRVLNLRTKRVSILQRGNHPSWSPDSRQLVFEDSGQIYVMNADGSDLRQLTH